MKVNNGQVIANDVPTLDEDGRREAERGSWGCRHCAGCGLVLIDACNPEARVQTCAATCVCLMGRWVRTWHAVRNPRILDRIPELGPILDGTQRVPGRAWTYWDGED